MAPNKTGRTASYTSAALRFFPPTPASMSGVISLRPRKRYAGKIEEIGTFLASEYKSIYIGSWNEPIAARHVEGSSAINLSMLILTRESSRPVL